MAEDIDREDARMMFKSLANQIPDTMQVTQSILMAFADLKSVRPKGSPDDISVEALHDLVALQLAVFGNALITIDNRLEKLEGRPGVPDDRLDAIMSEFL